MNTFTTKTGDPRRYEMLSEDWPQALKLAAGQGWPHAEEYACTLTNECCVAYLSPERQATLANCLEAALAHVPEKDTLIRKAVEVPFDHVADDYWIEYRVRVLAVRGIERNVPLDPFDWFSGRRRPRLRRFIDFLRSVGNQNLEVM